MSERIDFAITKTEILETSKKDQLAKIKMWIVREGNNLHNLPISWEAIEKAKDTLVGKPVLCAYDKNFRMFKGHDKDEVPVGVFLSADDISEEVDDNGQRWLTSNCYIWKKYFPHVMDVFKEDHGESAVSMEIEVAESSQSDDVTNIDVFSFLGVTLIGISPAIPEAKATVINFSQMVEETKQLLEFGRYDELDFKIPSSVKENARKALEERKKTGKGGTSVSLAVARWLANNDNATPDKVRQIAKYFKNRNEESADPVAWNLMGGGSGRSWSTKLLDQMSKKDEEKKSYFSGGDEILSEEMKMEKDEEEVKQEEEMSAETPETEAKEEETKEEYAEEEKSEEETESEEEKKEEEQKGEEGEKEEMSLNAFLDATAMLAFLEEETEAYKEMVSEFACDDKEKFNYGKVMGYMFSRMQSMAENAKTMTAELNSLKEFKASYEKQQFEFAVAGVLEEVRKVGMPKTEIEHWQEESLKYGFESVNAWANACKAAALPFAVKSVENDGITRIALLDGKDEKKKNGSSVWNRI